MNINNKRDLYMKLIYWRRYWFIIYDVYVSVSSLSGSFPFSRFPCFPVSRPIPGFYVDLPAF